MRIDRPSFGMQVHGSVLKANACRSLRLRGESSYSSFFSRTFRNSTPDPWF